MDNKKNPWEPIQRKKLKTVSIFNRFSKVDVKGLGKPWKTGDSLSSFLEKLPDILVAKDFKKIVEYIVKAHKDKKVILLGMGAHPIKVGLSPIIIDLMSRGIISGIALNGAGIIHDFELSFAGKTSEEVDDVIKDGSFGMTQETAEFLNNAVKEGYKQRIGLGQVVGEAIYRSSFPYKHLSILAAGFKYRIPVTVHVAIGTDVIHMHSSMDGAATGFCSLRDFEIFTRLVSQLEHGLYLNLGSAVILPEVFLKAVSLARNLGYKLSHFVSVNMDFQHHYRPQVNVINRPPGLTGRGYNLIGHHEIMFPLLAAMVIEGLNATVS